MSGPVGIAQASEGKVVGVGVEIAMAKERRSLNHGELLHFLPHRFPFVMVDKVTGYQPGEWIAGVKNVAEEEPLLIGPERGAFPQAMLIEAIGQLGILLFYLSWKSERIADFLLGSVSGVEFLEQVPLGSEIILHAKLEKKLATGMVFSGMATCGGKAVIRIGSMIAVTR